MSKYCMGHTYTEKISIVYLKFKFNWVPFVCLSKLGNPTLARAHLPHTVARPGAGDTAANKMDQKKKHKHQQNPWYVALAYVLPSESRVSSSSVWLKR